MLREAEVNTEESRPCYPSATVPVLVRVHYPTLNPKRTRQVVKIGATVLGFWYMLLRRLNRWQAGDLSNPAAVVNLHTSSPEEVAARVTQPRVAGRSPTPDGGNPDYAPFRYRLPGAAGKHHSHFFAGTVPPTQHECVNGARDIAARVGAARVRAAALPPRPHPKGPVPA